MVVLPFLFGVGDEAHDFKSGVSILLDDTDLGLVWRGVETYADDIAIAPDTVSRVGRPFGHLHETRLVVERTLLRGGEYRQARIRLKALLTRSLDHQRPGRGVRVDGQPESLRLHHDGRFSVKRRR